MNSISTASLDRRSRARIVAGAGLMCSLLGVAALTITIAVAAAWAGSRTAWLPGLVLGLLLLTLAAMVIVLAYRRGLTALHQAIADARAGHLLPVRTSAWVRKLLDPVVADYDAMSHDLAVLFQEMERAQLHIIGDRNRHDAIIQSLPGALLIVDAQLRVSRANRPAELLFGRTEGTLVDALLTELLNPDEAGQQILRQAFHDVRPLRNAQLRAHFDRLPRRLSLNLTFFGQPGDGSGIQAAVILQDETEYRRLEELTHQTDKLVAMGEMAAGVAHELNTPLGTILGYATLLSEGKANAARRDAYVRVIHEQTRRCARIVEDLLAYARRPVCAPGTTELEALVREALAAVAQCQGRKLGVPFEVLPCAHDITVRGSAGQLDIVLVNLLVNATEAAATSPSPKVSISCYVEGDFGVVAVTDNGPGVAPEIRRKIFDPFFTTKPPGSGTGLGLALSHSIVTRAGGMLDCDESHRGGARMVLRLPLAAASA